MADEQPKKNLGEEMFKLLEGIKAREAYPHVVHLLTAIIAAVSTSRSDGIDTLKKTNDLMRRRLVTDYDILRSELKVGETPGG